VKNYIIDNIDKDLIKFRSKKILLAHSGGVDSCVLADILLNLKVDFSIAHCNFQLRGIESENDSNFVSSWSQKNKIPFFYSKFSTKEYCEINNTNIQLATRELRYQWFFELQNIYDFDFVFTAHHLNDQFETFLINSTRGSGLKGLLGILNTKKIYRPLLNISKKEIINYAKRENLLWREDKSNVENYYLRNKFRNKVLPEIEMLIPDYLEKFKTTLDNLNETREFIDNSINKIRKKIFKNDNSLLRVNINSLLKLKPLNFYLHELFYSYGFNSKDLSKLLKSKTGKQLFSKTYRILVDRDFLVLKKIIEKEIESYLLDFNNKKLKLPIKLDFKYVRSYDENLLNHKFASIDLMKIKDPLILRKPESKDYFYPIGMKGKKSVSKYFKDEKYSIYDKENQWLLVSNNDIVWVVGKRLDSRFAANKKSMKVLEITCV
jgi:tRNA(Ile)-lysidine synthase